MLNGSLDQGSLICLGYTHFFFSIPEPEYAYKRYAYKKHVYIYTVQILQHSVLKKRFE